MVAVDAEDVSSFVCEFVSSNPRLRDMDGLLATVSRQALVEDAATLRSRQARRQTQRTWQRYDHVT